MFQTTNQVLTTQFQGHQIFTNSLTLKKFSVTAAPHLHDFRGLARTFHDHRCNLLLIFPWIGDLYSHTWEQCSNSQLVIFKYQTGCKETPIDDHFINHLFVGSQIIHFGATSIYGNLHPLNPGWIIEMAPFLDYHNPQWLLGRIYPPTNHQPTGV